MLYHLNAVVLWKASFYNKAIRARWQLASLFSLCSDRYVLRDIPQSSLHMWTKGCLCILGNLFHCTCMSSFFTHNHSSYYIPLFSHPINRRCLLPKTTSCNALSHPINRRRLLPKTTSCNALRCFILATMQWPCSMHRQWQPMYEHTTLLLAIQLFIQLFILYNMFPICFLIPHPEICIIMSILISGIATVANKLHVNLPENLCTWADWATVLALQQ